MGSPGVCTWGLLGKMSKHLPRNASLPVFLHCNWTLFIKVKVTVHIYCNAVCFFLNDVVILHCAVSCPRSFYSLTCKHFPSVLTFFTCNLTVYVLSPTPINLLPSLCPPGLQGGRTVTVQWLSQGRTKREAETSTQVRYLINLSLIFVSLTLTLPHQKKLKTTTPLPPLI